MGRDWIRCDYCWGNPVTLFRPIQLKAYTPHVEWLNAILICDSCRHYLRGRFRYVKGDGLDNA